MHVFRACAQFNSSALQFSFSSQQLSRRRTMCPSLLSRDTASHQPWSEAPPPTTSSSSHFSPTQILNQVRIFQDHVTSPSKVHEVPEWAGGERRNVWSNFIFYFNNPLPVNVQCCLRVDFTKCIFCFYTLIGSEKKSSPLDSIRGPPSFLYHPQRWEIHMCSS